MLNSLKCWSMACGLRLNGLDSSVSLVLGFVHLPECHEWSVAARLCFLAPWGSRLLWQWLLHWWWVNGSIHVNRFLASTHQRLAGDCMDRSQVPFNKSSVWPDRKSNQNYPALVARAPPTVPHSRFGLDMTQNEILAQFHNYFVLEQVQRELLVANSFFKDKFSWPLRNFERLLSGIVYHRLRGSPLEVAALHALQKI